MTNLKLSNELCEVIGAFIGDGCFNSYSKHYSTIFVGDSNKDLDYYSKKIIPTLKWG